MQIFRFFSRSICIENVKKKITFSSFYSLSISNFEELLIEIISKISIISKKFSDNNSIIWIIGYNLI